MKCKLIILTISLSVFSILGSACGKEVASDNMVKKESVSQKTVQKSKEIADIFGENLIPKEQKNYYKKYFTQEFAESRNDDISDWKDKEGNWCYPAGYQITWIPSDDEKMAAQQFPEELLADMSTDELYQFIMRAHGQWAQLAFDTYAYALSSYYFYYNFIAELMQRVDCAEVVHKYYAQTTDDDVKRYSKKSRASYSDPSDTEKQELFQLMEGMEWFFLYKEGKSVPDERVFGLDQLKPEN